MPNTTNLKELAALFLKLGATAFGGPVAHIALMEDEVVTRRKWLDRQHFLDLVGATNLIPGPNSTELAIHIGQLRAGWPGLLVAGSCFIFPAMLIVLLLAWCYERFGTLPQSQGILGGVQAVVIAIIAQALWRLHQSAIKGAFTALIGGCAVLCLVIGLNELAVIGLAAVAGLLQGKSVKAASEEPSAQLNEADAAMPSITPATRGATLWIVSFITLIALTIAWAALGKSFLGDIYLLFLKIGSVVYGSGYVLLAYLRADLVEHLHWLTDRQLLDAISIGQVTPGPVFTTATFIGYQLMGVPGALVATAGIFLPSFLFVGLLSTVMERLKKSLIMRSFLDSVNSASLALMAVVTVQLAWRTFIVKSAPDYFAIVLATVALWVLLRTRLNSTWLLAGGAAAGALRGFAG